MKFSIRILRFDLLLKLKTYINQQLFSDNKVKVTRKGLPQNTKMMQDSLEHIHSLY